MSQRKATKRPSDNEEGNDQKARAFLNLMGSVGGAISGAWLGLVVVVLLGFLTFETALWENLLAGLVALAGIAVLGFIIGRHEGRLALLGFSSRRSSPPSTSSGRYGSSGLPRHLASCRWGQNGSSPLPKRARRW